MGHAQSICADQHGDEICSRNSGVLFDSRSRASSGGTITTATLSRQTSFLSDPDYQAVLLDKHAPPPEEWIQEALRTGNIFPDERDPFDCSAFHSNSKGYSMGHRSQASRKSWFNMMRGDLAGFHDWEQVDIYRVDADYAMKYGDHALGRPFPFMELKPMLQEHRQHMINEYTALSEKIRRDEAKAWADITCNPRYVSYRNKDGGQDKPRQPIDTIEGLYRGSLEALPEMWTAAEQIAEAGGPATCSWGVKKLLRVMKKLVEKYDRHPSAVTDIARSSVIFEILEGLIKGLEFAISNFRIVSLKNRFVEPADGYTDVLLNVRMGNDFLVEIQLHLRSIHQVKGESGHTAYKWFRRLLYSDDTYLGEKDGQGNWHGYGKWIGANGDVYEGQWVNGVKEGFGTYTDADGHRYVGGFKGDCRDGQCTFTYFDGSTYEGSYVNDKKEGYGVFTYADGQKYEGQWVSGKREGQGKFTYADGSQFEGSWVNHKREGPGTLRDPQGRGRRGLWEDDVLHLQPSCASRRCVVT